MAFHQKRSADSDIRELIWLCRDRYRFAHELIKPHANLPDGLASTFVWDQDGFYLPWSRLCTVYRRLLFDPQISLFENHQVRELHRWRAFVENECFARFIRYPDWIRCVLETANLIPSRGLNREIPVGDLFDDIIQDLQERSEHDDHQLD